MNEYTVRSLAKARIAVSLNLAGEAIPLPSSCPHTLPATKCTHGGILCDYSLLEVDGRLTISEMTATSGLKKRHYGANRKEWPVVVTYSKGEAFEVQQLLKDVVGECERIEATGGHRYKVLKNALGKVSQQMVRPVLFLRN